MGSVTNEKRVSSEDGWFYWNPEYEGHAPPGVQVGDPAWEVQYLYGGPELGRSWLFARSLTWMPSRAGPKYQYRYRRARSLTKLDPRGTSKGQHLPSDTTARLDYPLVTGLVDYFPNALAEVARLSAVATQQHHPDQEMHWDRAKSTEHPDKLLRHLVDRDTVDTDGIDHWAKVCWRALAGYQTYLEEKHGLPPSRASRNVG